MAKGKRSGTRRLVSRERISQAKYAKQHGLISKRAKLGNGRLSRAVEKKIVKLNELGAVPEYELRPGAKSATQSRPVTAKPIKLTPKLRADAKAKGYDLFGGQIIAPNKERAAFVKAIANGRLAGSVEVAGESTFRVNLADKNVNNLSTLLEALNDGELDGVLGDNVFSFTYRDYHPKNGATFYTAAELGAYLENYQFSEEEFEDFELWVLPPGETFGKTPDYVYERDRKSGRIGPLRKKRRNKRRSTMENLTIKMAETAEQKRQKKAAEMARYRAKLRVRIGDRDYKDKERAERAARRNKPKG
jgi:hypothetical protein